eukprot:m.123976 g.123976  ORF g.123976 m.123976 type:complete len:60 (+) comp14460_c0_seq1:2831-3010(+)
MLHSNVGADELDEELKQPLTCARETITGETTSRLASQKSFHFIFNLIYPKCTDILRRIS